MPRKARDEKLDTRTARLRLLVRREPYWRSIQEGRALGYRRLPSGKAGTWIARHYDVGSGRTYQALGSADDMLEADGTGTLTFAQAQDWAAAWFRDLARNAGAIELPMTVKEAMNAYLLDYEARGGKALVALNTTVKAHILPALGDKQVKALTSLAIKKWHHALAAAPARLRSAATDTKPKGRKLHASDTDGRRARRATANRILTVLKATLNHAFREGRVASDDAWRKVSPFKSADAAKVRFLTDDEATRLVNACPADLRRLVTAALLTGCRYGELISLCPADVNLNAGVLTVRAENSKSGKARIVYLSDEGKRFFNTEAIGNPSNGVLFRHADGDAWGKSQQFRPLRKACSIATIAPAISFHILRHSYASRLAMAGVPMAVIAAQLGHSDSKLTEKHYAHLAPGFVSDTIRAAFTDMGMAPAGNVETFKLTA